MTNPDRIAKAKRTINDHRTTAPLILAALPAHDAPPLGSRQIANKVIVCSVTTARNVLNAYAALGVATVDVAPLYHGGFHKVFRRRNPDDFEDSPNMYAAEKTEGEDA